MAFKTVYIRQQRAVISKGWETNELNLQLSQLTAWRLFPDMAQRRRIQKELPGLPELRRWS